MKLKSSPRRELFTSWNDITFQTACIFQMILIPSSTQADQTGKRDKGMAQAVSCHPLIIKNQVESHGSLCGICGEQSGRFFSEYFTFPISIFLSVLHNSSFIYHKQCIILATDSVVH